MYMMFTDKVKHGCMPQDLMTYIVTNTDKQLLSAQAKREINYLGNILTLFIDIPMDFHIEIDTIICCESIYFKGSQVINLRILIYHMTSHLRVI